jgi:hypothetical protein
LLPLQLCIVNLTAAALCSFTGSVVVERLRELFHAAGREQLETLVHLACS